MSAYGQGSYGIQAWGSASGTEAGVGSQTFTPFTTYAAIRANMAGIISGLVPPFSARNRFRLTRTERVDFRDHANNSDPSVLREFEIMFLSRDEPGVHSVNVIYTVAECELVVAYPHHWGLYSSSDTPDTRWNAEAMRAVALQDQRAIVRAIGRHGSANYVSGQHAAIEGQITLDDDGEGVSFLTIPLELTYYQQA